VAVHQHVNDDDEHDYEALYIFDIFAASFVVLGPLCFAETGLDMLFKSRRVVVYLVNSRLFTVF